MSEAINMTDHVAKAIYKARPEQMHGFRYDDAVVLARAAIAAMREPTEAMLAEAFDNLVGEETCARIWREMIDEALK